MKGPGLGRRGRLLLLASVLAGVLWAAVGVHGAWGAGGFSSPTLSSPSWTNPGLSGTESGSSWLGLGEVSRTAESAGARLSPELERVPVLLVPGWGDTGLDLQPLRQRFLESGWDPGAVRAVTFEDPVGSNREHARELAVAIAGLREETGEGLVDVVAHSMGGLAVRYYLLNYEEGGVRKVAFLATPHRGTVAAYLGWGDGSGEMEPGSEFLQALREGAAVPPEVEALNVLTPVDLRVFPRESSRLEGVRNVEVCCPTHPGLVDSEAVFEVIRDFLLEDGS